MLNAERKGELSKPTNKTYNGASALYLCCLLHGIRALNKAVGLCMQVYPHHTSIHLKVSSIFRHKSVVHFRVFAQGSLLPTSPELLLGEPLLPGGHLALY